MRRRLLIAAVTLVAALGALTASAQAKYADLHVLAGPAAGVSLPHRRAHQLREGRLDGLAERRARAPALQDRELSAVLGVEALAAGLQVRCVLSPACFASSDTVILKVRVTLKGATQVKRVPASS